MFDDLDVFAAVVEHSSLNRLARASSICPNLPYLVKSPSWKNA